LFLEQNKHYEKIKCTDIIVSFKDLVNVSAMLLQNAFEMMTTTPFIDASYL